MSNHDIRVLKQKDVADCVRSVLQDKPEVSEIQTALHRIHSRYNKAQYAEREVFHTILEANMSLANAVRNLTDEVISLRTEVAEMRSAAA